MSGIVSVTYAMPRVRNIRGALVSSTVLRIRVTRYRITHRHPSAITRTWFLRLRWAASRIVGQAAGLCSGPEKLPPEVG